MLREGKLFREKLNELLKLYHSFDGYEPYDIPSELFSEYYLSGQRIGYEREYFKKRGLFTSSAVLFMLNGGGEYKTRLVSVIESILNEKTWALPAHIRAGEENPERVIDLFSAETAQSLCEIVSLMPEACDAELKRRIKEIVFKRIAEPFEHRDFAWEKLKNNWSAVCGGCVGMVYLYMFPERFNNVRGRILRAMESYIQGFGNDGICAEGLLYWNLGFGYYLFFARALYEYDKTDIIHNEKVNAIARFQQNMFMKNGHVISFSDSSHDCGFNLGITSFLINNFSDITLPSGAVRCDIDNCYRLAPFSRSFLWGDDILPDNDGEGAKYFPNAEWYINRQKDFTLAAKCGNNDESHNHNDVGSFIIADNSGQIIVDFGAGEYTADYFNEEKRYNYFAASSKGHNVPLVNGQPQSAGQEFCGKVIKAEDNIFVMDIGGAYKENLSVTREITVGRSYVMLTDDGGDNILSERFVSFLKPVPEDGAIRIGKCRLNAFGAEYSIKKHIVNGHDGKPKEIYTTDYARTHYFVIIFEFLGGA